MGAVWIKKGIFYHISKHHANLVLECENAQKNQKEHCVQVPGF